MSPDSSQKWKEPASSFDYSPVIQERTSTVGDFLLCASALTAVHVDVWVRLHLSLVSVHVEEK